MSFIHYSVLLLLPPGHANPVVPADPVRDPLPNAPSMKLYCLYGVGIASERGYHYLKTKRANSTDYSINNIASDEDSGLVSWRWCWCCWRRLVLGKG